MGAKKVNNENKGFKEYGLNSNPLMLYAEDVALHKFCDICDLKIVKHDKSNCYCIVEKVDNTDINKLDTSELYNKTGIVKLPDTGSNYYEICFTIENYITRIVASKQIESAFLIKLGVLKEMLFNLGYSMNEKTVNLNMEYRHTCEKLEAMIGQAHGLFKIASESEFENLVYAGIHEDRLTSYLACRGEAIKLLNDATDEYEKAQIETFRRLGIEDSSGEPNLVNYFFKDENGCMESRKAYIVRENSAIANVYIATLGSNDTYKRTEEIIGKINLRDKGLVEYLCKFVIQM